MFTKIVFDLFHTLVDPEEFRPKDFLHVRRISEILSLDEPSLPSSWRKVAGIKNRSNDKTVLDYINDYQYQLESEYPKYQELAIMSPKRGVEETLRILTAQHDMELALLANCDELEVRKWSLSPLAKYFKVSCLSFEIGHEKPEPEAFHEALRRLGEIKPRETVFVGDGGSNELSGAKALGFGLVVWMKGFVSRNGLRDESELTSRSLTADW